MSGCSFESPLLGVKQEGAAQKNSGAPTNEVSTPSFSSLPSDAPTRRPRRARGSRIFAVQLCLIAVGEELSLNRTFQQIDLQCAVIGAQLGLIDGVPEIDRGGEINWNGVGRCR